MSGRKVPPLFWIEQQQRGLDEEDLQELTEEEEEEFFEETAYEDLGDPAPKPVLGKRSWERILCFFSTEEQAWAFFNRYYKLGQKYLTGEPVAIDDFQVKSSDDVDDLLALCEEVTSPELFVEASGFAIDPPLDFLDTSSPDLALDLTEVRKRIWQKSEELGAPW